MSDEERFREISVIAGELVKTLIDFDATLRHKHGIHADLSETIRRLGYIEGLCGVLEEEE